MPTIPGTKPKMTQIYANNPENRSKYMSTAQNPRNRPKMAQIHAQNPRNRPNMAQIHAQNP